MQQTYSHTYTHTPSATSMYRTCTPHTHMHTDRKGMLPRALCSHFGTSDRTVADPPRPRGSSVGSSPGSPAARWVTRGCPSDPPYLVSPNSCPCDWPPPCTSHASAEVVSRRSIQQETAGTSAEIRLLHSAPRPRRQACAPRWPTTLRVQSLLSLDRATLPPHITAKSGTRSRPGQ